MRTFCEDLPAATAAQVGGPWSNDEVIVTNRYGLRSALAIAQPTGQFLVTNSWDAAGRWQAVGRTAGTFTYAYPADSASSKPWVSFMSSSATSGLYHYGYRFYDPYLQRWLNRDPIATSRSLNLYEFTQNCPYLYRDHWGLSDKLNLPFGPRFTTGNPFHLENCEQLEALIMDLERNAVGHEILGPWAEAYLEQLRAIWDDYCDDEDGGSECPDLGPAPVPQLQPHPSVYSTTSLRNEPAWTPPWQQPCLTANCSVIIVGGAIILVECFLNPINGPLPP